MCGGEAVEQGRLNRQGGGGGGGEEEGEREVKGGSQREGEREIGWEGRGRRKEGYRGTEEKTLCTHLKHTSQPHTCIVINCDSCWTLLLLHCHRHTCG